MQNDKIESPLDVPMIDADAPYSSSERQIDEKGRPFITVAGRKYVLAEEEDEPDLGNLPEDPRLAGIPAPPREISFFARAILFLRSTSASGFGWIWLCGSMIFVCVVFGFTGSLVSIYEKSGAWESFAKAQIVSSEQANWSINGESPTILLYEGVAPDGSSFSGRSYMSNSKTLMPGVEVDVEKKRGTSDVLRVQGARLAPVEASFSNVALFFVVLGVFILLGVWLAIVSPTLTGRRFLKLLTRGESTSGVPVDVRATGTTVNGVAEQVVTFRFRAQDGNDYETKMKTMSASDLTDSPAEILFYDPEKPQNAVILDGLPRGIKIKEGRGFTASFASILVPLFFVVVFLVEIAATCYYGTRIERATFSIAAQPTAVAEDAPK